ncbi:hypothetical protein GCM10009760_17030 [Kitasatospora kazusensis]|uniref:PepSY domain-containing protein n=1 Tax=Kitasatospora kazusensis TaxID=407974 RepID=A0ABN2Z5B8_9ACTN
MSESFPPTPEQPGKPERPAGTRAALGSLLPRRRAVRLAALGAVAVIVGGGAAAVALDHHSHEDEGGRSAADGAHGRGGHHGWHGRDGGQGTDGPGGAAPAPLPLLPATQAAAKAADAVPGGRVETLQVVGQQGGGSAWQAVVLGKDGVRHAITLAGADGAVTGNTVVGG